MPAPRGAAATALQTLEAGHLRKLSAAARTALEQEPPDARVHVAMALGLYHDGVHEFMAQMEAALSSGPGGRLDHPRGRQALTAAEAELGRVEQHLAEAARDERFALELCLACWEVDWNRRNGVDENDRLLFQIELDGDGVPIPEGDPRRMPTFRFDRGDVYWARAMVAFQRAIFDVIIAYDWHELDGLFDDWPPGDLRLGIKEPARIEQARARVLEALEYSDRSRVEYLAEVDDDREWVPAPTQRDHPMPLPMDAAVYETWEHSVRDLQALVAGEEGLSVSEIAQLGDHQWEVPPGGFIDIGRLLSNPTDVVIPIGRLWSVDLDRKAAVEEALANLLGPSYVPQMRPSPLVSRLHRMKNDVDRGNETFERKLRYLFWIN